jgi:hypothetical protein
MLSVKGQQEDDGEWQRYTAQSLALKPAGLRLLRV